jgi:beta-lactamase regulating signal transducer with metallopeptidase domain
MTHLNFAMTTLLNGIWQGALLAVAMWIVLKLFPRVNPTTRFTVLWLTLLAVAMLPVGPLALTEPATGLSHALASVATTNAAGTPTFVPVELRQPELASGSTSGSNSGSLAEPRPEPGGGGQVPAAAISPAGHSPIQVRSRGVMAGFGILWAVLTLVLLARLGASYLLSRRLKSGATPCPKNWQVRLTGLCAMNGVRRQTRLLVSDEIAAPMSLGFFHPAILIPQSLLDTLSESEVDHVVLHELAHLLRYDDWTNLAQKLIEALLPIQPAAFWLGRRMSLVREMACDDWVIAATGTPKPYAVCLTKVAELSHWEHAGILAAGAAGNRSQLFQRVHHMLDRTRNTAPKLSFGPVAFAAIAVIALIYEAARAPQMIVFAQDPAHEYDQTAAPSPLAPVAPLSPQAPMTSIAASAAPLAASLPAPSALAAPAPLAPSSPAAPMAPLAPLEAVASQQGGETHMHMTEHNGTTSFDVQLDGKIEFTDDDSDVKSLSPNGRFRLEEGGVVFRAHVRGEGGLGGQSDENLLGGQNYEATG